MTATLFDTGLPGPGPLQLQCCGDCGQVNYPPRELCGNCLASSLQWQAVPDGATVQSTTTLHYSLEAHYRTRLPWTVAAVLLDCGPLAFAHLQAGAVVGDRVRVRIVRDGMGNRMLAALHREADAPAWLHAVHLQETQE